MLIFFKNAHRKANDNLFRFLMTSIQSLNYTNRAVRVHVLYCAVTSCWETCDRIIKVAITYTLKKKTYSGSRSRRVLCRQQKGELFHMLDKLKVTFFIIENWTNLELRIQNWELNKRINFIPVVFSCIQGTSYGKKKRTLQISWMATMNKSKENN